MVSPLYQGVLNIKDITNPTIKNKTILELLI